MRIEGVTNISSGVSTLAPPNTAVYSATKAAVDAVTRSLAKELGPHKIRANAINPGMVETEGVHARWPSRERLPQSRPKHREIALTPARQAIPAGA